MEVTPTTITAITLGEHKRRSRVSRAERERSRITVAIRIFVREYIGWKVKGGGGAIEPEFDPLVRSLAKRRGRKTSVERLPLYLGVFGSAIRNSRQKSRSSSRKPDGSSRFLFSPFNVVFRLFFSFLSPIVRTHSRWSCVHAKSYSVRASQRLGRVVTSYRLNSFALGRRC